MKQVIYAVALLLLLHFLALAGVVGWLRGSGRLNKARAMQVVQIFKPTLEDEKKAQEQADQTAKDAAVKAQEIARMNKVAAGPLTLEDRIRAESESDDIATQRYERLQRETADLRHQLEMAKVLLNQQKVDLDVQRKAIADAAARQDKLLADQTFQQTVAMYEQLKATQVKQMFVELLKQGKTQQVLDYLTAMQQRKAGAVFKEFKTPDEIAQVADLLERLRARGIDTPAVANQPAGNPT